MRRRLRAGYERLESALDAAFPSAWNPLYQLGTLGWFFYWVVTVSGVYLYVFFDTGVQDAYESLERITHVQWYAGGVMRSLHRYASDALVVVMVLHAVREFLLDRYRGARWLAWVSGIAIVWLVYAAGIGGYWLVWDELAQYVAIVTTEWLDVLPLFGGAIARNFLDESSLSGRFFTLLVFIHIAVPLVLLFVMWLHVQRLTRPRVNPPRGLALGTLAALVAVSLARPAVSQPPADLDRVPATVGLDWFYLFPLPAVELYGGTAMWVAVLGSSVLLALLPFLRPRSRPAPAVVHLDNCNGCGRCEADCPYNAVSVRARSDGLPYAQEAVVDPDLCVACGLCTGACPTATPFRQRSSLVAGIEQPAQPVAALREACLDAAARLEGSERVLAFGCETGVDLGRIAGSGVGVIALPCVGMLPPSFVEMLIVRRLVDGVLVVACRDGGCRHRFGLAWTRARLERRRDPRLRQRVPETRLDIATIGLDRPQALDAALASLRASLPSSDEERTRASEARPEAVS